MAVVWTGSGSVGRVGIGILHPDDTPRLAYHAPTALRRAYPAGSVVLKDQHLKEPFFRLARRRRDGRIGWALWLIERGAEQPTDLRIAGPFDALGRPREVQAVDGRAKVTWSGRMCDVIGPQAVEPGG